MPFAPAATSAQVERDGVFLDFDDWDAGWVVTSVDVGFPEVRERVTPRPGSDGVDDFTSLVGARAVSITLFLGGPDPQLQLDQLAPYLDPRARPVLHLATVAGAEPRILPVRAGDLSGTWERPGGLEVQVQWRSTSPWFASALSYTAFGFPAQDAPGFTFPLSFDWVFPVMAASGPAQMVNAGNRPAGWVARLFGPITAPVLRHEQSGQAVALTGLVVAAGDYVVVDSLARTVHLTGDPAASRYSTLDSAATRWFGLAPGPNTVRLTSAGFAAPAQVEFTWRDSWL